MDHRSSPRIPCPFRVTIDHQNLRVPSCVAPNASRDGLSILTRGVLLPIHVVVNVRIKHDAVSKHLPISTPQILSDTVPALVIYSTSRQAGLCFYEHNHVWAKYWDLVSENQETTRRASSNGASRGGHTTYQIGTGFQTYPVSAGNDLQIT